MRLDLTINPGVGSIDLSLLYLDLFEKERKFEAFFADFRLDRKRERLSSRYRSSMNFILKDAHLNFRVVLGDFTDSTVPVS